MALRKDPRSASIIRFQAKNTYYTSLFYRFRFSKRRNLDLSPTLITTDPKIICIFIDISAPNLDNFGNI